MSAPDGNGYPSSRSQPEPGDHSVDTPITCVLSRFELRSPRHMLPSYRDYRRVVDDLRQTAAPGFLDAAFLVQNPTTWFGLSLWTGADAIAQFGTDVPGHVAAARRVFARLRYDNGAPALWSTKWRLDSVSHNLNWPGLDLRSTIVEAGRDRNDER